MAEIRFPDATAVEEGGLRPCEGGGKRLLLIRQQGRLHCVENHCGHFGAPLATGRLREGAIECGVHGIAFSLESGEVVNRPWERCRPIQVFAVREEEGAAVVELPEA